MNQINNNHFWKIHLSWWVLSTIYITFPTYKLPQGSPTTIFFFYVLHYFSMVLITYAYRIVYSRMIKNEENYYVTFSSAFVGVTITGSVFFLINSDGFIYHYKNSNGIYTFEQRLAYLIDCIWVTIPWFAGFHFFRYSRLHIEREMKLENSLQESELDRLRKQLNPHFLFNALNGIKALVLTEPKQAREAISQLSDLLRLSLKTNLNENIILDQEVEILENYLSIEKIRFEDRMKVEIDIPASLRNYKVLPFCLQILAENAVKHGIGRLKKGGTIKVLAEKEGDNLNLRVINTGSLTTNTDYINESTSIGLENLKRRLKINFGEKAKFDIEGENGFVIATIVLPLEV